MANPFELLKAKVSATNDVLKRKKVGYLQKMVNLIRIFNNGYPLD